MNLFRQNNKNKGFTLIEMLVSMSIFTTVTVIAFSALFSILKVNERAKIIRTAINSVSIAMESITRELRVGYDYLCVGGDRVSCGNGSDGSGISFTSANSVDNIKYIFTGNNIRRTKGRETFNLVSDSVTIDTLKFYIIGQSKRDGLQPRVLIIIKGTVVGIKDGSKSFEIQTTVSQRNLDI